MSRKTWHSWIWRYWKRLCHITVRVCSDKNLFIVKGKEYILGVVGTCYCHWSDGAHTVGVAFATGMGLSKGMNQTQTKAFLT